MARQAQYQREEVLDQAMQVFWDMGYCETSMARLVEATSLKPGSLYAAFKSKQGLFLASLDHYADQSLAKLERFLSQASSPLTGIREYFTQLGTIIEDPQARHSCLLVNTALEHPQQDTEIHERVQHHFKRVQNRFEQTLLDAQNQGEISQDQSPEELSAFLLMSIWGLRVSASTKPQAGQTQALIKQVLRRLD